MVKGGINADISLVDNLNDAIDCIDATGSWKIKSV